MNFVNCIIKKKKKRNRRKRRRKPGIHREKHLKVKYDMFWELFSSTHFEWVLIACLEYKAYVCFQKSEKYQLADK